MSLSVAIMGHPVRRARVRRLVEALDRDQVPVLLDKVERPSRDPAQRWRVAARAWAAHDPAADWHLVIQDDAEICCDLTAGLEKALAVFPRDETGRPKGLVSAYTGTGRPRQANVRKALAAADRHGAAWADVQSLMWGPAILAPTWTIPDMLAWCEDPERSGWNLDYRIGVYYRDILGWRTWYTVPSLVNHGRCRSLVGHDGGPERRAHRFLGTRASALDVDWGQVPPAGIVAEVEPRRAWSL